MVVFGHHRIAATGLELKVFHHKIPEGWKKRREPDAAMLAYLLSSDLQAPTKI